ncbi:unnamed protein product, partial [Durusdinium trenchii]
AIFLLFYVREHSLQSRPIKGDVPAASGLCAHCGSRSWGSASSLWERGPSTVPQASTVCSAGTWQSCSALARWRIHQWKNFVLHCRFCPGRRRMRLRCYS